jgi:hypothetical protein
MRIALLAVAGLALVAFLVVAVVLPQMAGAQVKDAAQTLIAGAEPAKQQVGSAATKAGRLEGSGAGVKVPAKSDPKYGEMKWVVSQNGAIRGWNEQNAIEITLMPTLQGGQPGWTCKGYPVSAMPGSCGGRS